MSVNDRLADIAISHQLGIHRYSIGVQRRIIALLSKADADLVRQVKQKDASAVGGYSEAKLTALLDVIRTINAEAYRDLRAQLRGEMRDLAGYERDFQIRAVDKVLPVKLTMIAPPSASLYSAAVARPFQGRLLKEVFRGMEASAFTRIRAAIRMGYVQGESNRQIIDRVTGASNVGKRDAEKVVRTAVSHFTAVAREETFKENADFISGEVWSSAMDSRTSPPCRARDGLQYTLDHKPIKHNLPYGGGPGRYHWQCRSIGIPMMKSLVDVEAEMKRGKSYEDALADMDGKAPETVTYFEWLAKKPASFQNNILGVKKGKLFRIGKLPPERFTDQSGREYTLPELEKREQKAWKKAGL